MILGMQKRWVAAIVVALVVVGLMQTIPSRPSVAQGQSGSDAPYIYYYSNDLNAWVIERADGSDRRLLGQDLMPEGTNAVGGPGWSPSGKWFAWTSYWGGPYNATDWDGWVMSADGQTLIAHFGGSDDSGGMTMQWSPSADLLIVAEMGHKSVLTTGDSFYVNSHFSLFNAETGQTIASLHTITEDFASDIALWTNDGRFAITRARSTDERVTQFYLFSPDGTIFERLIPDFIYEMPSPTGVLILDTPDGPRLVDLITNTTRPLTATWGFPDPTYDEYSRSYTVDWNSSGTQGLIKWGGSWLVDVAAAHIRQITPLNAGGPAEWSPDERYIFVGFGEADSVDGYGYLVDIRTGRAFDLPYYPSVAEFQGGWSWADNQNLVIYGVNYSSEDGRLTGTSVTWVNLTTGQFTTDTLSYLVSVMDVSPNARYLGWVDEGALIFDHQANEVTSVEPNAYSYGTFRGGEIRWLDDTWLIEYKDPLIAGGRGLSRWVRVMRLDGTGERELTFCYDPSSCIGILPDTVDPTLIPFAPLTPQIHPVETIHETAWTESIIWRPDGQVLAVSSGPNYPNYGNRYRLYETGTGHLQGEYNVEENYRFDWELTADNQYAPTQIAVPERTYWQGLFVWVESPDGRFLDAGIDSARGIYDVEAGTKVFTPHGWVVFNPDSSLLLTIGSWGSASIIWDTTTWTEVAELPSPITAAAFSPDGQYLAVGVSWDVEIWRVSDLIGAVE